MEKVEMIRERMLVSQKWQKSYANLKNRPKTFEAGEQVLLKGYHREEFFVSVKEEIKSNIY